MNHASLFSGIGGFDLAAQSKSRGLKLQPGFAFWMMGFPEDWTELPFLNGEKKA